MFPLRYFNNRYFTGDYWPHLGVAQPLPTRPEGTTELRVATESSDTNRTRPEVSDGLYPTIQ